MLAFQFLGGKLTFSSFSCSTGKVSGKSKPSKDRRATVFFFPRDIFFGARDIFGKNARDIKKMPVTNLGKKSDFGP